MATQTIFRSSHHINYTVLGNELINQPKHGLSFRAVGLLTYLLSKPKDWLVKPEHLASLRMESLYIIRQILRELREQGYVILERLKTGCTLWFVYDTPQKNPLNIKETIADLAAETPVEAPKLSDSLENIIPPVIQSVVDDEPDEALETLFTYSIEPTNTDTTSTEPANTDTTNTDTTNTAPTNTDTINTDTSELNKNLVFPEILSAKQRQQAESLLKQAPYALQAAILSVLSSGLKKERIKSPFAYLRSLVNKANNGEFEVPIVQKPRLESLSHTPFAEQVDHFPEIDNLEYFIELYLRLGEVALKSMSKDYQKQVLAAVA